MGRKMGGSDISNRLACSMKSNVTLAIALVINVGDGECLHMEMLDFCIARTKESKCRVE